MSYDETVLEQHTPAHTTKTSREVSNLIVSYLHALTGANGPDLTTVIRTVIPEVVKQKNSCDCGLFVLHYFSAFLYCKDVHELVKNFRETPIPTQHLWPNVEVDPIAGRIYVLQCLVNIQGCHVSDDSSQFQDVVHGAFNTCLKLPNHGNTCYINVILQLLLRLPIITDAVIAAVAKNQLTTVKTRDPFIAAFLLLFEETKKEIPNEENVELILKSIVEIGRARFRGSIRQQDCHELLICFLQRFLTAFETMGILENVGFRGTEYLKASTACCPTCPLKDHVLVFETLSLPIPDVDVTMDVTIQRCVVDYMSRVSKDTDFKCPNCLLTGALVQTETRIRSPPKQLIIQLVRNTFDLETKTAGKNEALVTVTTSLDMATSLEVPRPCMYSLAFVVFHEGKTLDAGHYFVAVKLVAEGLHEIWYVLNDGHEKERVNDIQDYLRKKKMQVYIVVYESNDSTTGSEMEDDLHVDPTLNSHTGVEKEQVIRHDNSQHVCHNEDVEDVGHEKGHENAEPFVWLGQCDITEHIIVDRDEQSKVAADKKLYNCKKQYRNKAGNLSDVRWKRIGVYENESEGKLAAGDLCRPCGHRWVNMRRNKQGNSSMTFVCAWEKCQFVMRLVEQSDNKYELCVVEDRQHVHDIVSDGKVPNAITLYVQKKWKEYCLLAPSAVKHLMTTAHVNNDISVDDRALHV